MTNRLRRYITLAAAGFVGATGFALAHGDVTPQPVETPGLPELGDDWASENPFRDAEPAVWERAIRIGSSAYSQNCARCHGLEVISGGLAPDLRFLQAEEFDDEWFIERTRHGAGTQMPAFDDVLSQEAMWAIRTYVETRPDDHAIREVSPELREVRDGLREKLASIEDGTDPENYAEEVEALSEELAALAVEIPTLSGAPVADSIARQAAMILGSNGGADALRQATETLTIGLPAAQ